MPHEILVDVCGTNDFPLRVTRDRDWTEATITVGPESVGFDYTDDGDRSALIAVHDALTAVLDQ